MFSFTVVATTGERFSGFEPYVASVTNGGVVAFQAALRVGGSGVFAGDGSVVTTVADTSGRWNRFHGLPVITGDGTVVFRADCTDGVQGIYAGRGGSVRAVAETGERFASLSLFPSANESGSIAFAAT